MPSRDEPASYSPAHGAGSQPPAGGSVTLPPGLTIIHAGENLRRIALALLLTGRTRGADASVDQFLIFARNHHMTLDRFWLALDEENQPVSAALIVAAPGRAGMLFLSPVLRDQDIPTAAAMVRYASQPAHVQDLAMVQMLLDPHQQREYHAVLQADFTLLARLQYMRRRVERSQGPLQLPDGMEVVHWSEENRSLFGDAILASYQDTLDCPGLLGLRQIDDIIAGHMSAGEFIPRLWHVVHHQRQPVAVMLLSPLASRDAMELVYLGLAPGWRGQGLARKLMHYAIGVSSEYGAREILLAVDENNTPALKLYQSLKFTPTARKLAMLRAVIKTA